MRKLPITWQTEPVLSGYFCFLHTSNESVLQITWQTELVLSGFSYFLHTSNESVGKRSWFSRGSPTSSTLQTSPLANGVGSLGVLLLQPHFKRVRWQTELVLSGFSYFLHTSNESVGKRSWFSQGSPTFSTFQTSPLANGVGSLGVLLFPPHFKRVRSK